jgi:hypothetical protein
MVSHLLQHLPIPIGPVEEFTGLADIPSRKTVRNLDPAGFRQLRWPYRPDRKSKGVVNVLLDRAIEFYALSKLQWCGLILTNTIGL